MERIFPDYEPLGDHEIRVLELQPGDCDAPIVVSLKHISLREQPSYEAISYVWGNGNDLHTILHEKRHGGSDTVARKTVTATRNLRDALKHFRDPKNTRTIWADALCINQQDTSERAQQVRLMGEIYTKADRVLLWLGLADEDTEIATDYLKNVSEYCLDRMSLAELEKVNNMGEIAERLNVDKLPQFDPNGEVAAWKVFERPWFKRIWVVQEVAAGQDVTVLIGRYKMPFSYIGIGATWLRESRFSETATGSGHTALRNASIMWQKRFGAQEHPADLLDDGRDLLATDSRDKIYGLLGFKALRDVAGIGVAYDKTIEEVYTDTALAIIRSTGDLDVLSFAEGPPLEEDPALSPEALVLGWPDTPLWVARWDEETWFPTSAMCGLRPHRERFGPPAAISFADAKSGVLSLEGHVLDTVVYVAPYVHWPESPDAGLRPINSHIFADMWNDIARRMPEIDPTRLLSAWAQVLTGGITANRDLAHDSADQHCADLIAFMLDALEPDLNDLKAGLETTKFLELLRAMKTSFPNGDRARFQMAMVLLLTYRRVFVTAQGHLGLGHSKTREGDVAVWLFGGRLPFVLRKSGEHWNYVGEGFLYNVEKGKMHSFEDGKWRKSEFFELR